MHELILKQDGHIVYSLELFPSLDKGDETIVVIKQMGNIKGQLTGKAVTIKRDCSDLDICKELAWAIQLVIANILKGESNA